LISLQFDIIRSSWFLAAFLWVMTMVRMVDCVVLGSEAPGLERVPYPGELGQRIFDNVSEQGWKNWLERQTMIINENGLSTVDPASLALIELHMVGFLFKEGDLGQVPDGFRAAGGGK
jgi:Fe-S cluster biosynthesis and repair protein YggX